MSQQECARSLGITRQTVISIEKGHFDPRLSLAFRIARLFGRPMTRSSFRVTSDKGPPAPLPGVACKCAPRVRLSSGLS